MYKLSKLKIKITIDIVKNYCYYRNVIKEFGDYGRIVTGNAGKTQNFREERLGLELLGFFVWETL